MNQSDIRQKLVNKRNEILGRVQQLNGDIHARAEPYSADSGERAVELQNLDVLFQIDAVSRMELNAINNALERMEVGCYGVCIECGKKIDRLRLQALPYTEICIKCATTGSALAAQQC